VIYQNTKIQKRNEKITASDDKDAINCS